MPTGLLPQLRSLTHLAIEKCVKPMQATDMLVLQNITSLRDLYLGSELPSGLLCCTLLCIAALYDVSPADMIAVSLACNVCYHK